MSAIAVIDEMNNVGRHCHLSGDERRWLVIAAMADSRVMVRDTGGNECRIEFVRDLHNLI